MVSCLGIDPDSEYVAMALGCKGSITDVYSFKVKSERGDLAPMLRALSIHIPKFINDKDMEPIWPLRIVIEGQKIYPGGKARPNDILLLGQIAGMAAGVCASNWPDKNIIIPTPSEWKGSVPKRVHQARVYDSLGWGYKQKTGYSVPRNPDVGKHLKSGEWKHVGDAVGLCLWGAKDL